jgi:hypothetical protein
MDEASGLPDFRDSKTPFLPFAAFLEMFIDKKGSFVKYRPANF